MKRYLGSWILAVLAVWLCVAPDAARADPRVTTGRDSRGEIVHRIYFDSTTAETTQPMEVIGQCVAKLSPYGGSGTVDLYEIASDSEGNPLTISAGGTQIGAGFTARESREFSPTDRFIAAVASVASDGSVLTVHCSPSQAVSSDGVGAIAEYDALASIDGETVGTVLVTDCADGDCTAGGGTAHVPKYWNGSAWVNFSATAMTDAEVLTAWEAETGRTVADDGATVDALESRQFRVEKYASGSSTGGIVEAFAACATAGGGTVLGPGGSITIDATGVQTPIIELPAIERDSDDTYFGGCRWEGYDDGSERQVFSAPKAASFILFDNMDDALADDNGFRPAIQVTAPGQDIRGLNIGIDFSASPVTAEANSVRAILLQSKTPRVGVDRDLGQEGINNFSIIDNTIAGPVGNRLGIGLEFQFALKGVIRDNHISNFKTDVLYSEVTCTDTTPNDGQCDFNTSHAAPSFALANNSNLWSGNTIRTAVVGFEVDGFYACRDLQMVGNTIEGLDVLSMYFHNDSECHVLDNNVHYESNACTDTTPADGDCDALTSIAAADQAQVYIDSDGVTYSAFGVRYGGSAQNAVYRNIAHAGSARKDTLFGTWSNSDIKYTSGASVNLCGTVEVGSRTGGGTFNDTCVALTTSNAPTEGTGLFFTTTGAAGKTTDSLVYWDGGDTLQSDAAIIRTNIALLDGSTYTGAHDFGGATVEVPNGTAPTLSSAGDLALDTLITDWQNALKYFDGSVERTVISIPSTDLATPTDDFILKYNATTDDWEFEADAGAAGGDAVSIDGVAATDPDFVSDGDVDFVRCTGAGTPDASCVSAEDVLGRIVAGVIPYVVTFYTSDASAFTDPQCERVPAAVEVLSVHAFTGSSTVAVNIETRANPSAAGTDVLSSDVTASTTGAAGTVQTDGTEDLAAGEWLCFAPGSLADAVGATLYGAYQ